MSLSDERKELFESCLKDFKEVKEIDKILFVIFNCIDDQDEKHTKAFIEKLKDLLKDGDYYGDRSFTDLFKRIDKTAEEEFGDKILK